MKKRRYQPQREDVTKGFKLNEDIKGPEVRLTGEYKGEVYKTSEALAMAKEQGLDLILITANAKPPVCQIVDFKKYLYEKKKREKELKSKQQQVTIKEVRFTPNTDEHDFDFKAKQAEGFLKKGSKVKAYVHFKGRAIVFKDRGELLLLKLADHLKEYGDLEALPKLEGKRMNIFISPKKKK